MNYSLLDLNNDSKDPKHIICFNDIPLYEPNKFLNEKGINSSSTRSYYAKQLVRFFNFFEDKYGIIDYRKIKRTTAMDDYMEAVIYNKTTTKDGQTVYLKDMETKITIKTAKNYMRSIQLYYLSLEKPLLDILELDEEYLERILSSNQFKKLQQKTKYKGIWNRINLNELKTLAPNTKWRGKHKSRVSFKSEEIDVIAHNLRNKSLRQLCIFLTCLETGARIDEVLSSKRDSFKQNKNNIWVLGITKSKTQVRYVGIQPYLAKLINTYINTERRNVTSNSQKYKYLFLSTKGKTKGDRIGYHSFYTSLKHAAKAGGINSKEIVTHMARATKSTGLKADGKTDEQIRKVLGNKEVLDPYIDFSNPEVVVYSGKALYHFDID
jgi:integrase